MDELFTRYPALSGCEAEIRRAAGAIIECYERGGKLLACGNGGSCADADHVVGELMKGFTRRRPLDGALSDRLLEADPKRGARLVENLQTPLRAINLCAHAALASAFQNDVDAQLAYAQQTLGYADEGDVLLGISTSGNAENVLCAGAAAKARRATLIGLTGAKPCGMDGLFDIVIHAPETETYKIQELHLPIYHALCLAVERRFFEV